jgi:hypothetical protein
MQCSSCLQRKRLENSVKEATTKVWCPTWSSGNEGVLNLCDEHSAIFKNAKSGQFFFDDEATEQFIKVEAFITKREIKFESLKAEILRDGYHIAGDTGGISSLITVFKGFVYVITCNFLITKLGKLEVVQKEMPKLFPEEGHRMIYVRAGDGDDYNGFVDLHGAIEYLQELNVKVDRVTKTGRFSYEAAKYKRTNHISLYWGRNNPNQPDVHEPICELTEDEVKHINERL